MWTPSQVNLKFRLNFWNYQPSCLLSPPHWARVRRYEAVRPVRPYHDSVAICAPRARLSPCRGSESLAPRVEPSQQPPPAQHTVQIQQPSTVMFTITPSHPLLTRGPWQYIHPCNISPSPAQSAALATLSTPVPISTFDQSLSKRVHWGR